MSLFLALLIAAGGNIAQPTLARVGDCGWVHGRYSIYNGAGVRRIWMIGTSHMLNLYDWDSELPAVIQRLEKNGKFLPGRSDIFGDFLVCAQERRIPGHMQHVRFKAAKSLFVAQH